ncbi:MAG: hypothetical protein KatS3mg104_2838 [Phycisphaerae bacterium]|jgi:hypothetical protein|nr:MAG: hypothetical protein KatS3mg104_2838 [Phycisphaerae bacterium]
MNTYCFIIGTAIIAIKLQGAVIVSFDNNTTTNPFRSSSVNLATSVSGSLTDSAFNAGAGVTFNLVLDNPKIGVNVNLPSAPDFSLATNSFFGAENTGMGVGNANLGRFERGESFTLTATQDIRIESFLFHEWNGDESLYVSWTRNGIGQSGVFSMASGSGTVPSLVTVSVSGIEVDAYTSVLVVNVSPTTANSSGRLRFRNVTLTAVPEPMAVGLCSVVGSYYCLRRRR